MMQFISRAYNSFEVDSKTNAIVYKRSKESRLSDEAEYYKNLPDELRVYFPRVLSHTTVDGVIELGLEYYAYDNLGNLMIHHEFQTDVWEKIFSFIMKFLTNANSHVSQVHGKNDCRLMYINKTETEYYKLLAQFPYFQTAIENRDFIYLNGEKLLTFRTMWPKLREYIEKNCLVDTLTYVHGDMCFSNILYGKNSINGDVILKFIDPRGSFGNTKYYGDPYYDLAKLMHSCDGRYEYFITDNFTVTDTNNEFKLVFNENNNAWFIQTVLDKLIKQSRFNSMKVELLQGLIFVGMCARHYDSPERQKGMFLTGLRILNTVNKGILQYENLL